jgi:hypothetical protein
MDYGQYLVLSIALTILLCSKVHECPATLQQISSNGKDQWLVLLRFLNGNGLTVRISGSLNYIAACTCISSYTLSTLLQVWPVLHFTPTYLPPLTELHYKPAITALYTLNSYPTAILNHGSFNKIHITADTFQGIINANFTTLCKAFWIHQTNLFKSLKW